MKECAGCNQQDDRREPRDNKRTSEYDMSLLNVAASTKDRKSAGQTKSRAYLLGELICHV